MSSRWTEEEAREYGLRKDSNGNWHQTRVNSKSRDTPSLSKPKHPVRGEAKRQNAREEEVQACYELCVISFRTRTADADNLCPKAFIDVLVDKNYLPDDSSKYVRRVTKEIVKVKTRKEEKTVIEIWKALDTTSI